MSAVVAIFYNPILIGELMVKGPQRYAAKRFYRSAGLSLGVREPAFSSKFPDDYAGGYGNVERVLGAELRDFNGSIAAAYGCCADAFHLVSQDESVSAAFLYLEGVKRHAGLHLLDG
jgi:hypothetical protein